MRAICSLLIFLTCATHAQVSSTDDFERLRRKIANGDHEAILDAGSSGDERFVPALHKVIRRYAESNKAAGYDARLALAKLGDKDALEAVLCEVHSGNPYIQTRALVKKLPYIGGWFAISTLAEFLPDRPENHRGTAEGDTTFGSLMHVSVTILRELLPSGPPAKPNDGKSAIFQENENDAKEWQQWIERNKGDLTKLKPTGNYLPVNCAQEAIQSDVGTQLRGIIFSSEHAGLANCDVVIAWDGSSTTEQEFGLSQPVRVTTTNSKGEFSVDLFPGPYDVCVRASGFERSCHKIRIEDSKEAVLRFRLRVKAPADK